MDTGSLGKTIILVGFVCIVVGIILVGMQRIPWLGKLPGDIYIKKENFSFYFPLTTSLIISLILSVVFWLWSRR